MGYSSHPSRLRSQGLRWFSVLASLIWFSGIAAQTFTVSADDPSITYTGDWIDEGNRKFTTDASAFLDFEFIGTGVSYISWHDPSGGIATISIDGQSLGTVDESANTHVGDEPQEAILFSHSGLDGSQTHTLQLSFGNNGQFGGVSIDVYGFEYVQNGVAPTSLASTPAESSTASVQPATSISIPLSTAPSPISSPPSMSSASTIPSSATASSSTLPSSTLPSSTLPSSTSSASRLPASPASSSHLPKTPSSKSTSQSSSLHLSSLPTSSSPSAAGITSSTALPSTSSASPHSQTLRSALIGGIIGGVLGVVLLFLLALCLFRRRADRRRQRTVDPEHKARSYTSHTDTEDGYPHDYTSPGGSMSPISRKETMTSLSGETVNNESYRPVQYTGAAIAPALGVAKRASERTESDSASAVRGDGQSRSTTNEANEATRRASISSDSDSHGHSPSNSQGSARYVFHRLPRVPPPKI